MVEEKKAESPKKDFKYIIRIANSDVKGEKGLGVALKNIKGVGYAISNYICKKTNLNPKMKAGNLSDAEVKKISDVVDNLSSAPKWLLNRRKDVTSGENKHIVSNELLIVKDTEMREIKKLKSYRGIRHIHNLPVRGQKTRSNFRRNKGKVLGVKRAKKGKKG